MQTREMVTLLRDCPAVLIPAGDAITLKKGQEVMITQDLGGSYTVIVLGNMARIEGKHADAIGKDGAAASKAVMPNAQNGDGQALPADGPVDEALIWDQLRTCYDPEIPVNIVDLGLVYDLIIAPLEDGSGSRVQIMMTLTAPGCGMGDSIADDVKQKVLAVPGVTDTHVELVWEPLWNQAMMSEAAQLQLGFL